MLPLLLQAKQEMQQGRRRQLALPFSEQEGADAVEAVVDTKVSTASIIVKSYARCTTSRAYSAEIFPHPLQRKTCAGGHHTADCRKAVQ